MVQLEGPKEQPREVREHYEQSKNSLIMMVDDEPVVTNVVQAFLEKHGYKRFITCDDSTKAIEMIRSEQPDVLLLDLIMPNVTGYDILYELAVDEATRHIPVIVLTTAAESKLRCLELGATDFLGKPVDVSELALRLRNTLTVKAYQDRLAKFDQLTGLPNRKHFQERVHWAFRQHQLHGVDVNVIQFDLDRLRMINNTLTSGGGDQVLEQFANRIIDISNDLGLENATQARLGGDEFAIVFTSKEQLDFHKIASAFLNEIRLPMYINGREVVVLTGIGIATTTDVATPDELIQKANVAVKHAKSSGVGKVEVYSSRLDSEVTELMELERDLRHAIDYDELKLFYQPKLTSGTKEVFGFEALLRWQTNDGSLVSPGHFIPVAENSGLIIPIGKWILKQACLHTKQMEEQGIHYKVSVNVSAHQLIEPDIVISIREALEVSQLDPSKLIVEITENVMMGDVEHSLNILHDIRSLGCSLSVDDFGTGYSSLSYLKRFPIEELKVDQSFLKGVPEDAEDAAIVRAIIALAKSLELKVTAEGVENDEQATYLADNHCDLLQGYHYSKPLPYDELKNYCSGQRMFIKS